ncbi:hypothetical protein NEOKW01_1122 [Nematocida sp. AWRm80]|nr:hypothetical protein NEOKW01_1122 [Nematocida sp. AWRm80]
MNINTLINKIRIDYPFLLVPPKEDSPLAIPQDPNYTNISTLYKNSLLPLINKNIITLLKYNSNYNLINTSINKNIDNINKNIKLTKILIDIIKNTKYNLNSNNNNIAILSIQNLNNSDLIQGRLSFMQALIPLVPDYIKVLINNKINNNVNRIITNIKHKIYNDITIYSNNNDKVYALNTSDIKVIRILNINIKSIIIRAISTMLNNINSNINKNISLINEETIINKNINNLELRIIRVIEYIDYIKVLSESVNKNSTKYTNDQKFNYNLELYNYITHSLNSHENDKVKNKKIEYTQIPIDISIYNSIYTELYNLISNYINNIISKSTNINSINSTKYSNQLYKTLFINKYNLNKNRNKNVITIKYKLNNIQSITLIGKTLDNIRVKLQSVSPQNNFNSISNSIDDIIKNNNNTLINNLENNLKLLKVTNYSNVYKFNSILNDILKNIVEIENINKKTKLVDMNSILDKVNTAISNSNILSITSYGNIYNSINTFYDNLKTLKDINDSVIRNIDKIVEMNSNNIKGIISKIIEGNIINLINLNNININILNSILKYNSNNKNKIIDANKLIFITILKNINKVIKVKDNSIFKYNLNLLNNLLDNTIYGNIYSIYNIFDIIKNIKNTIYIDRIKSIYSSPEVNTALNQVNSN